MEINKIYQGETLETLKTWPDNFIDCIITSPPYWSLRSYLPKDHPDKPKEIGLEPTFKIYLDKLFAIFEECHRVLKPTGSMWVNIGDSYGTKSGGMADLAKGKDTQYGQINYDSSAYGVEQVDKGVEKSLIGQPWRLALKLIDEGQWILRADIVWAKQVMMQDEKKAFYTKGSAMPSSVKDRVNMTHEHLFHFTKSKKYFYDLDAVRIKTQTFENRPDGFTRSREFGYKSKFLEDYSPQAKQSGQRDNFDKLQVNDLRDENGTIHWNAKGEAYPSKNSRWSPENRQKNLPSVWLISSEPSHELHFAKFPGGLVEIPIKATCPEKICKVCGKIREKIIESTEWEKHQSKKMAAIDYKGSPMYRGGSHNDGLPYHSEAKKIAGYTSCSHNDYEPGLVLDPFMGSGTVAKVARYLGRNYCGIELNGEYIKISEKKLAQQILG